MSSIDEMFKDKILQYDNASNILLDLKNKRQDLLLQKENTTNIKELLEIDSDLNQIDKDITILSNNKVEDYLIKLGDLIHNYGLQEEEHEFKTKDTVFGNLVKTRSVNNKGELYTKYMKIIENKPEKQTPNINFHLFCKNCNEPWSISNNDALYICKNCGEYETYFETTSNGMTYEQEINSDINVSFAYKRSNHLREILAQLQAKETSNIPDEILNALRTEFKKARITKLEEITQQKVKMYLKKLKFNKYYENTRQITNILNGKPPPTISDELYEKFINLFMEIQEPFDKVCPKNRKNFFSYNYILYKFCELLNETDTMQLFPLLKSREKLYQQDCIWKNICEINNWPFYKSV